MGIGGWGLRIGDWAKSPIPIIISILFLINCKKLILTNKKLFIINLIKKTLYMAEIKFIFGGIKTIIQCNINEKMDDIYNKYTKK